MWNTRPGRFRVIVQAASTTAHVRPTDQHRAPGRLDSEKLACSAASLSTARANHVEQALSRDASGHDCGTSIASGAWPCTSGAPKGADLYVVELAALLHDIADWKFHDGDLAAGRAPREPGSRNARLNRQQSTTWPTSSPGSPSKGPVSIPRCPRSKGRSSRMPTASTPWGRSESPARLRTAAMPVVRSTTPPGRRNLMPQPTRIARAPDLRSITSTRNCCCSAGAHEYGDRENDRRRTPYVPGIVLAQFFREWNWIV